MAGLLPPGYWCTAYWFAGQAGLLPYGGPGDPDDEDFLHELDLHAWDTARQAGLEPWLVPEGPRQSAAWPEHIWNQVADAMAQAAAESGDWCPRSHDELAHWLPLVADR